jgi:hypothetical protein
MQCRQVSGEILPGGLQAVGTKRGEAVENEHGPGGGMGDPGADALAPIPAAAGHAGVVAPHHLARLWMLDNGLPVTGGIERLVPGRTHQPGRPEIPVEVFSADGDQVFH